jgi:hypothetical protein
VQDPRRSSFKPLSVWRQAQATGSKCSQGASASDSAPQQHNTPPLLADNSAAASQRRQRSVQSSF